MTSNEIVKVDKEASRQFLHLGRVTTEFGHRSAFLSVTYDESGRVTRQMGVTMPTRSMHDRSRESDIEGEVIEHSAELEA